MRNLLACSLLILFAVSACAPIPFSSKVYLANPADITSPTSRQNGSCFVDGAKPIVNHQVGRVNLQLELKSRETDGPTTLAAGRIESWQYIKDGPLQTVSLNPNLIKLEVAGRRISPSYKHVHSETGKTGAFRVVNASFRFPLPKAGADDVRLIFQRGAVKVGGKTVDLGTIRYSRKQMTSVYVFPCIPS